MRLTAEIQDIAAAQLRDLARAHAGKQLDQIGPEEIALDELRSGVPAMGDALAAGEGGSAKEDEDLFLVVGIPLRRRTVELGAELERRDRSISKRVLDRELPECRQAWRILSVQSRLADTLELDSLFIALAHPPVFLCRRPAEVEGALVLPKAFWKRYLGNLLLDGQQVIAVDVQHDRIIQQADHEIDDRSDLAFHSTIDSLAPLGGHEPGQHLGHLQSDILGGLHRGVMDGRERRLRSKIADRHIRRREHQGLAGERILQALLLQLPLDRLGLFERLGCAAVLAHHSSSNSQFGLPAGRRPSGLTSVGLSETLTWIPPPGKPADAL
jgi:hypothetical protein